MRLDQPNELKISVVGDDEFFNDSISKEVFDVLSGKSLSSTGKGIILSHIEQEGKPLIVRTLFSAKDVVASLRVAFSKNARFVTQEISIYSYSKNSLADMTSLPSCRKGGTIVVGFCPKGAVPFIA